MAAGMGQSSEEENAAKLAPRWAALCKDLGISIEVQQKWWDTIRQRHGEPQRAYHTLAHLCELFDYLDAHAAKISDTNAVSLAIFFHDVIYDPRAGSPKNEADSAIVFDGFGQEALPTGDPPGLAKGDLIAKVRRWIVQTAAHKVGDDDDEDCKLFMDFDMAVLGRPWEQYELYSQQIRFEYGHVSEAFYCKARGAFLAATASGPPIFATQAFRDSHEQQARDNMAREAQVLEEKFARCGFLRRLVADVVLSPSTKKLGQRVMTKPAGLATACAVCVAAPKIGIGCVVTAAVGTLGFGLRLLFGARYVRYPYPEPSAQEGTVVLAGSYNPPHLGHLEMLRYLSKAHNKVVAVIGVNPNKKYDVSAYQRQAMLTKMLQDLGITNVEVVVWGSIIFNYARSVGASIMYRGIRTWKEDGRAEKYLEYQNLFYQLAFGHWPIPTAYLQGAPALCNVSSTLLRKRLSEGASISDLVPESCAGLVQQAYAPETTKA